ncbi:hypothetical protein [Streptomyces antibioticus]|uniref:hypothetical protein n=1 Tax=Streptomyces antibioticus TaxID=1890 RepID=UPI0033FC6C57
MDSVPGPAPEAAAGSTTGSAAEAGPAPAVAAAPGPASDSVPGATSASPTDSAPPADAVSTAAPVAETALDEPAPSRPAPAVQAPVVASLEKPAPADQAGPEAPTSVEPAPAQPPADQPSPTLPTAAALLAAGDVRTAAGVDPVAPETTLAPPKDRRVLRAVARWVATVGVFALAGVGTAYAAVGMERTEVPGLATESDGRWAYPEISRPPVPTGGSTDGHLADVRRLLLPAPAGAAEDKALRGADGWLATKDFLAIYSEADDREEAAQVLTDNGLRHIAARGWTTEDGTRTGIYLLQFDTAPTATGVCSEFTDFTAPKYDTRGAEMWDFDDKYPSEADVPGIERHAYDEVEPYGAEHLRQAYLCAGDVVAVIVQARKGTAAAVPFQQTVVLQSQLLS